MEERPDTAYTHQKEWNHLFIDLGQKKDVVRNTVVQQQDDYANEIELEKLLKPKLYSFPEWDSPVAVFDFEDLESTEMMHVLCVRKDQEQEFREDHVCYVWNGPDFDISQHDQTSNLNQN